MTGVAQSRAPVDLQWCAMEGDGTITRRVRMLRQVIEASQEKLRELGTKRKKKSPKLAIDRAYPSGVKKKRRRVGG